MNGGAEMAVELGPLFGPAVGLSVLGLALALLGEARGWSWALFVGKPAASLGFLVAAVSAGALRSAPGQVMFGGLCLAALGDVLLMWRERKAFLAGLVAFLLGHLAYAGVFAMRGLDLEVAGMAAALILVVSALVVRWLLPKVEAAMKVPVLAYVAVVGAMVALAFGSHAASPDALLPLGAVLFWVSDISVAVDRFVMRSHWNRLWGLPCYYGAQFVLAAACAGLPIG